MQDDVFYYNHEQNLLKGARPTPCRLETVGGSISMAFLNSPLDGDEPNALFTVRCDNRDVFAVGLALDFLENRPIKTEDREFVIKRAQAHFGSWPVHFIDHGDLQKRFTGYRVMANCSAFNPDDPGTIEKAILMASSDS